MKYYVKYIKTPKKQAYVEKTKLFSSFEKALAFSHRHYTIELCKCEEDGSQRQRWDDDMREWYSVADPGWAL